MFVIVMVCAPFSVAGMHSFRCLGRRRGGGVVLGSQTEYEISPRGRPDPPPEKIYRTHFLFVKFNAYFGRDGLGGGAATPLMDSLIRFDLPKERR